MAYEIRGTQLDPNFVNWMKSSFFGNWAPEDQEWGMQQMLQDNGGLFGDNFEQLSRAYARDPKWAQDMARSHADAWFKNGGHQKTAARNQARDADTQAAIAQQAEAAKVAATDKEAADAQGRTNTINAQLDEFYRQLSQPIDPNDPEIQRVASMAGRSAVGQAYGRGIEGGLSVANTQSAAGGAAADMFQRERERRDGLRAQVGSLRAGGALNQQQFQQSQGQIQEATRRYNEGLKYDDAMNQYNYGLQRQQGIGGAIGAGLGALGFIGGPAVGAATTAAGSQLGAGGAGLLYRPPPRRSYSGGY